MVRICFATILVALVVGLTRVPAGVVPRSAIGPPPGALAHRISRTDPGGGGVRDDGPHSVVLRGTVYACEITAERLARCTPSRPRADGWHVGQVARIPSTPAATAGGDGLLDHAVRDAPGVSAVAGAAGAAMPAAAAAAVTIRRLGAGSSATQLGKAARRGIEPAAALHVQVAAFQEDVRRL